MICLESFETTNGWSRAFGGELLWGDQPLRYVFVDEAGTSAREPVTVVTGIIADADSHVMSAEALALEAIGAVPEEFRDGFVFHAMQVYGDKKYQSGWSLGDRLRLLKTMMSIPRRLGMNIAVAAQWRNAADFSDDIKGLGLTHSQFEHCIAFSQCVAIADRNIRTHAGPREVATVVAEDVPEMRKFLKHTSRMLREDPYYLTPEMLRELEGDKERGYSEQSGEVRVSRIRNSIHFVEKADDPLVQIADACAYGFRRFFAGEKFGVEFAEAILGDHRHLRHFQSPGGVESFTFSARPA